MDSVGSQSIQIEGEDNLAIFSEVRRTNPPPTYVLYIRSVLEYFRKAQLKSERDRRAVNDVEYLLNKVFILIYKTYTFSNFQLTY